jgi:hypothetical protein
MEDDRSPTGGQLFANWRSIVRQLANDQYIPGKEVVSPYETATYCREKGYLLPKKQTVVSERGQKKRRPRFQ